NSHAQSYPDQLLTRFLHRELLDEKPIGLLHQERARLIESDANGPLFPGGDRDYLGIENEVFRRLVDVPSLFVLAPLHHLQLQSHLFFAAVDDREGCPSGLRIQEKGHWNELQRGPGGPRWRTGY